MLTDWPPLREPLRREFLQSDQIDTLEAPPDNRLRSLSNAIEAVMESGERTAVQLACAEFLEVAARFHGIRAPQLRVLAARPLSAREGGWSSELFGDYDPQTKVIRVWMRTAVRKEITSFGTLLSTLCHEFCHHLDYEHFRFHDSPHTRGFYERAAALYHQARGTPRKRLFWKALPGDRWRIDWPRTKRGE
jgi:hypothetical protein